MNRSFYFTLVACFFAGSALAAAPDSLPPLHPCDIITMVSRITIPRIEIGEPTTLKETLHFIYTRYRDMEVDPPRDRVFLFDCRLPEATLQRHVSVHAKNITMIQAIKLALTDIPVVLTFEPGKLIISPASSQADAPTSTPKQ